MEWTTERRYRPYEDWTQEEIQNAKIFSAKRLTYFKNMIELYA